LAEQFIVPLYLVEYPIAIGPSGQVHCSSNCRKFNGYDRTSLPISEPTESAGTFHGGSAWPAIKADPKPDHQIFNWSSAAHAAVQHIMRLFTVQGASPARTLDEVLARMEALGAVADECEAVRRTIGVFLRWAERRQQTPDLRGCGR
jgi:hypothetical protein